MQRMPTQSVLVLCGSFCVGIAVATSLRLYVILFALCICSIVGMMNIRMPYRVMLTVYGGITIFLFGILWGLYMTPQTQWPVYIRSAAVYKVIERTAHHQLFLITDNGVVIQVRGPSFPRVMYGDEIEIDCHAYKPSNSSFAYEQYLWSQGIAGQCVVWKIIVRQTSSSILRYIAEIQESIIETVAKSLHDPARTLLLSIVFGRDDTMPDFLIDIFRTTGLTHVLVVSGMQIILLIWISEAICKKLHIFPWTRVCVVVTISFFYILMTGAQASIVRAGFMMCTIYVLRICGRLRGNIGRVLMYVAIIMLLMHPYQLLYDVGFELSFSAVFGLVFLTPHIEQWMVRHSIPKIVSEATSLSLATSFATSPIIAFRFQTFSIIGIVANICTSALWSLCTIISFGWVALVLCIGADRAQMIALPLEYMFRILVSIVNLFAHIPYASIEW